MRGMPELFHLTDRTTWESARAVGVYEKSTRELTLAEEGFIHCSLRHQVRGVADRFYADADDLVLLIIDSALVSAPIRYESPAPGAQEYPHIYGPLNVDAVVEVLDVTRDGDARFVLPD